MVPAALVTLERLPLSPNGKLDRKALPAPRSKPAAEPTGRVSRHARSSSSNSRRSGARCWAADIGVNDNFFDLGGHSLLAARVAARIRDAFRCEMPLRPYSSLRRWRASAARSSGRPGSPHRALPPVTVAKRGGDLPLSFGQQRLWFLEQLEPGTPLYNVPASVRLSGPLDVDVLTLRDQ